MSYTTFAKRRDTDKQSLSRWPPITRRVVYFVVKIYFLGKTKQSIQVLSMIWEYVLREWIFDEENQINLKQPTRKKTNLKGTEPGWATGLRGTLHLVLPSFSLGTGLRYILTFSIIIVILILIVIFVIVVVDFELPQNFPGPQINTCLVWWRSQCRGRVFKTRVSYQKGWVLSTLSPATLLFTNCILRWRQPWESVVKIAITLGYASGEVRVIIPRKWSALYQP